MTCPDQADPEGAPAQPDQSPDPPDQSPDPRTEAGHATNGEQPSVARDGGDRATEGPTRWRPV